MQIERQMYGKCKEFFDVLIEGIKEDILSSTGKTIAEEKLKEGYSYKKKSLHASEQERPRCTGETPLMERDYVWHKC